MYIASTYGLVFLQGKILKEKDHHKKDFKQRILQGISETKTVIKSHINKVSGKVKNWLWGKKVGQKTSKAGKGEL